MNIEDLINYLGLEGPHDLEHIPVTSEKDAPPPEDEFTDEEGGPKEEGDNPTEAGLVEQEDPEEDLEEASEREPMDEEDPKEDPDKDPSKGDLIEEEDPQEDLEEDPSEGEPIEEEDPENAPEEGSEVSEGQSMGSEDYGVERREIIM